MPRSQDGRWTAKCEVCDREFQKRRAAQRVCSIVCRTMLPHNTGGPRAKAGLEPRTCQNPDCPRKGAPYQPVRENQVACSHECLLKAPSYREAQRRTDQRPERRAAQNARRNLATTSDVEKRKFVNLCANMYRAGFRLTRELFDAWIDKRPRRCALCGDSPPDLRELHVDHDHKTGQLRDFLCWNCNHGLGAFHDDPALLRAAAEYIERHQLDREMLVMAKVIRTTERTEAAV